MPKQPAPKPESLKLTDKEPSLLFAIQELLKTGGIEWDEWWDEWKKGFLGRNQKVTNYRIEDWKQPKFIEITLANSKSGVRVIEYFPDRDDESKSYILSGTDRDLIHHIIAIGYQGSSTENSIPGKSSKPPLKGFPAIKLTFASDKGVIGTKIIRCVRYTDDTRIADTKLCELIKPADISKWARNIKTIFGDTKYCWKKGKGCLSYSGQIARLQGLEGYAFVANKQDGIALFAALLKIFELKPDTDGFNFSNSTSTTKYSQIVKKQKVLNSEVKLPQYRPVDSCFFYGASLYLPLLKKNIPLVRKNVIIYKS